MGVVPGASSRGRYWTFLRDFDLELSKFATLRPITL